MKTDNLVSSLKQYGIRAAAYKRPPIGEDVFALTISPRHKEGVVLVNHGNARVQISGSKKLRQAAVTVRESGRKVSRLVKWTHHYTDKPTEEQIIKGLRSRFLVIMPSNATWTVTDVKCEKVNQKTTRLNRYLEPYWLAQGKVTATVKEPTTNHFLIGMDETRHFISPISRHVKSVRGAHHILRPREVPLGALRQGEWFFLPCSTGTSRRLDRYATEHAGRVLVRRLGNTTHVAKASVTLPGASKDIYVRGFIMDNRIGHHKNVFLTKWHKVVKNQEATIKVAKFQEDLALRRRMTWD